MNTEDFSADYCQTDGQTGWSLSLASGPHISSCPGEPQVLCVRQCPPREQASWRAGTQSAPTPKGEQFLSSAVCCVTPCDSGSFVFSEVIV